MIKSRTAAVAAANMLLAACSSGPAGPAPASAAASGTGDCDSVTTCYTPGQFRVAYGIQPLAGRGIDGRGETVLIPALAEQQPDPPAVSDLRQDMAGFDKLFGLPSPRMQVVTSLAGPTLPWLSYGEETLDAEMVHAIAPRVTITIVLLKPADLTTPAAAIAALTAMLKIGVTHGDVISVSAAWGEHCTAPPSTTSPRAATQWNSRRRHSPGTRPPAAGTRSPAWAAPTHRYSSRCSRATPRTDHRSRRR